MALRRLSLIHSHLQTAVTVRAASRKSKSDNPPAEYKPVCPGNAFTLFLETQPREGKNLKKFIHEAACIWNSLPQEEKIEFQERAKDLEKKYHDEISKWEGRMLKKGRQDLVERHHQLTDGKNQAIQRYRQAMKDQGKNSTQTVEEAVKEEEVSSVVDGRGSVKDGVKKESSVKENIKEKEDSSVQNSKLISEPKSLNRNKCKPTTIMKKNINKIEIY